MPNLSVYQQSINEEFNVLQNRVRSLVTNWGEDGKYKEVVLSNILRKFLPKNISIYSGFCIRSNGRGQHIQSSQIDIILYDSSFPVLFCEGDFAIVPPEGILGIIEVKTNTENVDFKEVVKKANENGKFIYQGKRNVGNIFFNGIFSYEGKFKRTYKEILHTCINDDSDEEATKYVINYISLGKDIFIRREMHSKVFRHYEINNLSFVFYISNLIETLNRNAYGNEELLWYSHDKEPNYIDSY